MKWKGQFPSLLAEQRGSLLIVALWMISILTAFSLSMGYHVRQKITLADRIDRRNWLQGLAEVGVYHSILKIREEKAAAEGYYTWNNAYTNGKEAFLGIPVGEGGYTVSYHNGDPRD